EYFNALMNHTKPGERIELAVRRAGKPQRIACTVGQGVDQGQPLLSLFVLAGSGPAREWLAWTPRGVYDSSSERVERFLGWHFNPAAPGATGPRGAGRGIPRPVAQTGHPQAADRPRRPEQGPQGNRQTAFSAQTESPSPDHP